MIPGMNLKKAAQMMKRMGIQQVEIPAIEVVIKCEDKEIIIRNPNVSKVNMMGQQTYQIIGNEEVIPISNQSKVSEEDIKTVMEQAGVTKEEAEEEINNQNGDLAAAIISLKKADS